MQRNSSSCHERHAHLAAVSSLAQPVELRQIRYFVAVAEELHFGRAASRLFMAQPALSQSLQTLEQALGVALVNRTSRRVELTAAGEALLEAASELLPQFDQRLAEVKRIGRGKEGHLRIGINEAAQSRRTTELLGLFEVRHPRVEVELHAFTWADQLLPLLRRTLDVSIVLLPITHPHIDSEPMAIESRVAMVPMGHRLSQQGVVSLADLSEESLVIPRDVPADFLDWWTINPRPDGGVVRYGPSVANLSEALQHVAQDHGIYITAATAAEFYARPDVVALPIDDAAPVTIGLAWAKTGSSSLVTNLRDLARGLSGDDRDRDVA